MTTILCFLMIITKRNWIRINYNENWKTCWNLQTNFINANHFINILSTHLCIYHFAMFYFQSDMKEYCWGSFLHIETSPVFGFHLRNRLIFTQVIFQSSELPFRISWNVPLDSVKTSKGNISDLTRTPNRTVGITNTFRFMTLVSSTSKETIICHVGELENSHVGVTKKLEFQSV